MTIQYRGMRLASTTCTLKDMAKQGDILGMCGSRAGGARFLILSRIAKQRPWIRILKHLGWDMDMLLQQRTTMIKPSMPTLHVAS